MMEKIRKRAIKMKKTIIIISAIFLVFLVLGCTGPNSASASTSTAQGNQPGPNENPNGPGFGRHQGGPPGDWNGPRDFNGPRMDANGVRPNFDENSFMIRIKTELNLPSNATDAQVKEALGLPESAGFDKIRNAFIQKTRPQGIGPQGGN
jgi:hypothetical protein